MILLAYGIMTKTPMPANRFRVSATRAVIAVMTAGLLGSCAPPASIVSPEVDFSTANPATLKVGAAAVAITPTGSVYLAGGIPYRSSLNVHDDLWARAIVIDDGTHRVALVALDLIGLYYDDVAWIREQIAAEIDVDYVLMAMTHTHNGPDVVDAWSPQLSCGPDDYTISLGERITQAVVSAAADVRPATLRIAVGDSGDPPLSRDTRLPLLIDDTLTVWQATDAETGEVIVTAVHYAAHPILIPSFNFDVSSDFVHTLREVLESGTDHVEGAVEGFGGMCAFFNGPLGGRITPSNSEPPTEGPALDPAYAVAETYGYRLARRVREVFDQQSEPLAEPIALSARSRVITVPMTNPLLATGVNLCLLDRGIVDGQVNSEAAVVSVGPIQFFAVPGMIFPELVIGGLMSLPGSDFPDAAAEGAPLADLASKPYFICVGIANDMLGNIIPRMLWDADAPHTTDDGSPPYGEVISPGPDTAQIVIDAFAELQANEP